MLDVGHLPLSVKTTDVQVFNRPSTVTDTQWLTWTKPRGATMVNILAIGGGGGGGGGFTAAAAAARGGGGGGGSSAHSRCLLPCLYLPDILYIQVGQGGQGVLSGGGTAGSGILSYVSIAPNLTTSNLLLASGAAGAVGGVTGTGAAAGTGGAAGTAVAAGSAMPLSGAGQVNWTAGQVGSAGGAQTGAVGVAVAIPVTQALCQGGSGGAGVTAADFAGGLFTAIAGSWLSEQRPATPAAGTAGHGSGGPQIWQPFFSFGGGGGSSSNASAGANGGNGAHGAGGGGGGGGTTGGRGGNGGSGIVIILSW